MSERMNHQGFEGKSPHETKEGDSFATVCENLTTHLNVLQEAFEKSPQVALPNGEVVAPQSDAERVLGKIQLLRAHVEGYLEQNAEGGERKDVHETEKALRMVEESIRHLEQFLAIQADLVNMAKKKGESGAGDIAVLLRGVAHTLLSEERQDGEVKT